MIKNAVFTHSCDDQENKHFAVYGVKDKVAYRLETPYVTEFAFDSTQVNNQIYFCGGGMRKSMISDKQFFKTTARVTINPEDMDFKNEKLKDMNISRTNHTLVAFDENNLYAIGGYNELAELSSCEKYIIDKNKWEISPSLNEHKMWVTVCPLGGKYLYAFGGSSNLMPKERNTIEYLDVQDINAKWWTKIILEPREKTIPTSMLFGIFPSVSD